MIEVLKAKIHGGTITDANINYSGSVTISTDLLEKTGMKKFEKVLIVDINNGNRFETYVIDEKEQKGCICLNGAAARLVTIGDKVIIMAFKYLDEDKVVDHYPKIITLDDNNNFKESIKI